MSSKDKPHHDKKKKGKGAKDTREKPKSASRHAPLAERSASPRHRDAKKRHEPAHSSALVMEVETEVEVFAEVVEVETVSREGVDGDRPVIEHGGDDPLTIEDVRQQVLLEMESVLEETEDEAATAPRPVPDVEMTDEGVDAMRFPFWDEVEMEVLAAQEEEQMAMMEVELAMQAAEYIEDAELVEEAMVLESNRIVEQWQHALDPLVQDESE